MSFASVIEAETRLRDPKPLTEDEIRGLMEWMGVLSAAAIRRLDAESALQSLKAIRHFDESSGRIGTWGLALNVALFVLTIIAVWIAIVSYRDTNRASQRQEQIMKTQEGTLDASRRALESVADLVGGQTSVLKKSVGAAESQLKITQEEYKRELQKPDLEAYLLYPNKLSIAVRNRSKTKAARDVLYEGRLWNLSKPDSSGFFELLGSKVGSLSSIRPKGGFGPFAFQFYSHNLPLSEVNGGDKLFGYVTIECSECAQRLYWVYWDVGTSGYYREGTLDEFDVYHLTKDNADSIVHSFMRSRGLVPLPTGFR